MPRELAEQIVEYLIENALIDRSNKNQAITELIGSMINDDWEFIER